MNAHKYIMLALVTLLLLAAGSSERVRHYVRSQSIEWKVGACVGLIAFLVLITLRILGFPK